MKIHVCVAVIITLIHAVVPLNAQSRQGIILLCPNGGEILAWDSTYLIRWQFNQQGGVTYDFILSLSTNGGQSYPYPITGTINPDSNTLEWIVPHVSSTTCRVLIEVDSSGINIGQDESDGDFTISETGIEEEQVLSIPNDGPYVTILTGPLSWSRDINYKIFDITGRQIHTLDPAPGIYFIEVDGEIVHKIIKIK